jgi:hypothetical protein
MAIVAGGLFAGVMIELSSVVLINGGKQYLDHRKKLIQEGRQDELLSSHVRDLINEQIDWSISMGESIKKSADNIYNRMATPEKVDTLTDSSIPTDSQNEVIEKRPASYSSRVKEFIRSSTPQKLRSSIDRLTTPSKVAATPTSLAPSNPDFHKFIIDLLVFVEQEFELQKSDPESVTLKQKDYHDKLIRNLAELQIKASNTL